MAVRRATRQYEDLATFLKEYSTTLRDGAILLPASAVRGGDLAPEINLDMVLPIVGRVGPLKAQVVHRAADGSVALRLPEITPDARAAFQQIDATIETIRQHLISTGVVVDAAAAAAERDALLREKDEAVQAAAASAQAVAHAQAAADSAPRAAGPAWNASSPSSDAAGAGPPGERPRGLPVPDVSRMEPALTGDMSDRSFRDLMMQLAVDRMRALVTVTYPDGRLRYGYWDRGGPVGWRTDPLQEAEVLGVLLFRSGQITKEQLAESLQHMEDRGCLQGEAFIEMGLMTFPQLVMVLGKQVEFILQQIMQERNAKWALYPIDNLPVQFLPPPLRVPSLLYRGLVGHAREMRGAELAQAHAKRMDHYVALNEDARSVLGEIKFGSGEARFLEILQSTSWRMRELFSVSPLSRGATSALLWALEELGFLEYRANEDVERAVARLREKVEKKKRSAFKGTYFEVLEIHWICLPKEIEEAYQKMRAEYDMSQVEVPVPDDLKREAAAILGRLDEAFQVLSQDKSRREYRKKIIEPMMVSQSAELLAKKGEMAIMRKDRREACGCFAKALELAPGHPEFVDGLRRSATLV